MTNTKRYLGGFTEEITHTDPDGLASSRQAHDVLGLNLSVLAYDSEPGLFWVGDRQVYRDALAQTLRELLAWVDVVTDDMSNTRKSADISVVDLDTQEIIGYFKTADMASQFITHLPGALDGRYNIDDPAATDW